MASEDKEVLTVSEFREEMSALRTELKEIRAEIRILERDLAVNTAKVDMLQHTFYWGLGIIAIVVGLIPYFRRERKEEREIRGIVREEFERLNMEAVSKNA
ncbi:MAG: hypothetical protein IJQ58_10030 [Synergistaceae bacterium]|nr:hypothetical protein [Synergistaceae bacterium]